MNRRLFMSGDGQGADCEKDGRVAALLRAFARLTAKQHEVLRFVAENRTSKEIAWELGISESAVNQRIEGVRSRTGGPPRAELARAYRQYQQDLDETCKLLPDNIPQVPAAAAVAQGASQDAFADKLALADAVTFTLTPPWQNERVGRVVPEVLDGAHAGLSRTAAMVAIAVGMLVIAMVGLGVAEALSRLF
ncbi:helix-turn-helix domain-containing protein [Novosphingobium album (ex Hu et al. 2023)]|uniref:Helix-turn-helix transcriptional regulator n=1 Tax=Novosphingobium album (ex Hu et al. 2023) TaxID=2930093 RepID=A0ABT0AZB2_9SPHN|nr:helix-turn-helix transcriptional regulator [Novosphingobium album (ex Hu et al. 2023)]MCJ2178036.1 helix-turn-helix transcriptional regulator [Novosphingobium album (ex Hu et al. 2023)]